MDSSAAIEVVLRRVNGKLRHVRVGSLWIQEMVEDGEVSVKKVHGSDNMSDVLTKNVPGHLLDKHTAAMASRILKEGPSLGLHFDGARSSGHN